MNNFLSLFQPDDDDDTARGMSSDEEGFYAKLQACLHSPLTSGLSPQATPTSVSPQQTMAAEAPDRIQSSNSVEEGLQRLRQSIEAMSRSLSPDSVDFSAPPLAPPPPPLLTGDWSTPIRHTASSCHGTVSCHTTDNMTANRHDIGLSNNSTVKHIAALKVPPGSIEALRSSQLVRKRHELRSAVEPHPLEAAAVATVPTAGDTVEGTAAARGGGAGGCSLRASLLDEQRRRLLPTDQPHPSQLRDLSHVQQTQLNDLADVLKRVRTLCCYSCVLFLQKYFLLFIIIQIYARILFCVLQAVNERRVAFNSTATLDSVETTDWSIE